MKYAIFDEAGFPTAFYAPEIHGERSEPGSLIPVAAVEITDAQ